MLGRGGRVGGLLREAASGGAKAHAAVAGHVRPPAHRQRIGRGLLQIRPARHGRLREAGEREVEADVRAVRRALMDLHGDDIRAGDEQVRRMEGFVKNGLARAAHAGGGERGGVHRTRWHIVAAELRAIEIDDRAVVAQQPHAHCDEIRRVRHGEARPEIGRDVADGIRRVVTRRRVVLDDRGLIEVAVAEFRGAGFPHSIVEGGLLPARGALVGAVVEIPPGRAHRQQRGVGGSDGTEREQRKQDARGQPPADGFERATNVRGGLELHSGWGMAGDQHHAMAAVSARTRRAILVTNEACATARFRESEALGCPVKRGANRIMERQE